MSDNTAPAQKNDKGPDLLKIGLQIFSYRRLILGVVLAALLISGGYAFLKPPVYRSSVSLYQIFVKSSFNSRISALASQFGMGSSGNTSRTLYSLTDLIKSRNLLKQVVLDEYKSPEKEKTFNLIEYWETDKEEEEPRQALFSAIEMLKERLLLDINQETGLYTITMECKDPELSAEIVNRTARVIADYIRNERKTSTLRKYDYLTRHMPEIKERLTNIEDSLTQFREEHIYYSNSPELQLQYDRLERKFNLLQDVYLSLVQQLEMTEYQLVNEERPLNILDNAQPPQKRHSPRRFLVIAGGVVGGFVLAVGGIALWLLVQHLRVKINNRIKNRTNS